MRSVAECERDVKLENERFAARGCVAWGPFTAFERSTRSPGKPSNISTAFCPANDTRVAICGTRAALGRGRISRGACKGNGPQPFNLGSCGGGVTSFRGLGVQQSRQSRSCRADVYSCSGLCVYFSNGRERLRTWGIDAARKRRARAGVRVRRVIAVLQRTCARGSGGRWEHRPRSDASPDTADHQRRQ